MPTEVVNAVVIGGGLAGLGCAIGLKKYEKSVIVLEKLSNPVGLKDLRYNPKSPASFKSAGMMELYLPQKTILNKFMKDTRKLYDEAGVTILPGGMSIVITNGLETVLAEAVYGNVKDGEELETMKVSEPNLRYEAIKGIHRQEEATHANPEECMEKLIQYALNLGVDIRYEQETISVKKTVSNTWILKTSKGLEIETNNIIIAAGPWSTAFVNQFFSMKIPMSNVLGIITEFVPPENSPTPYLNGLVMGARSIVAWGFDEIKSFLFRDDSLDITRYQNEKKKETVHLYISEQKGNLFIGGPRILLKSNYNPAKDLDPSLYKKDMESTLKYAKKIVNLDGVTEKGRWSGIMAFPKDELPFIGPLSGKPGVYLCTGFASSGFREGPGAGTWLAKCIATNNGKGIEEEEGKFDHLSPGKRVTSTFMGQMKENCVIS